MTQKFSGYLYNFQLHYILIVELKKNKVEVCSYMRQGTKIGGLQIWGAICVKIMLRYLIYI